MRKIIFVCCVIFGMAICLRAQNVQEAQADMVMQSKQIRETMMAIVQQRQEQGCSILPVGTGAGGNNLWNIVDQAAEAVNIDLDENLLKLVGGLLNINRPDEARAGKLIYDLKHICVRNYRFDRDMQYDYNVRAALRTLPAPTAQWSRVAGVQSHEAGEDVNVFFRMMDGEMTGLAVIAAGPRELTAVRLDGKIRLEQLGELAGQFGIPKVEMPQINTSPKTTP